ncbi:LysR family transcriptional regulator [Massilia sp. TS11]|uniref:LysR family transcriptional regulator n=1 Tax=Massilia sp. TS11 TaxID=2908003 RepID=UPI001EDA5C61|nr:LysR family transcriptional regulator [Massilia sp. TS11]MCG2583551.1 LysR family transcriptional regulator [Massilia sp. TS11]
MDRLHLMQVFVAVAEEESFAAAARRLGMSAPAVTRAVAALEQRLGVKLLNRTTRHVRVSDAGARYLDDARRILIEVDEADEAAGGIHAAPRGHLKVTAPVLFGKLHVMPAIVDYLRRYPDTDVAATLADRVVNLMEEGIDVGVRIGELPDSTLHAIPVGRVRRMLVAAPGYLAAAGYPQSPLELQRHTLLATVNMQAAVEWRFLVDGSVQPLRIRPRLTVTSNDGAIEAARHGLGITRLMSYQVAPYLANGELEALLTAYELAPLPIHVIHREGRHASAKVRAFIDLIVDRLRADPSLR